MLTNIKTNSIKILFVDDNVNRITKFKQVMSGTNVWFAQDSQNAILILSAFDHFDYIFLDYDLETDTRKMEKNNGGIVGNFLIKHRDQFTKTKVIVHSYNEIMGNSLSESLKQHGIDSEYIKGAFLYTHIHPESHELVIDRWLD